MRSDLEKTKLAYKALTLEDKALFCEFLAGESSNILLSARRRVIEGKLAKLPEMICPPLEEDYSVENFENKELGTLLSRSVSFKPGQETFLLAFNRGDDIFDCLILPWSHLDEVSKILKQEVSDKEALQSLSKYALDIRVVEDEPDVDPQ